MAVTLAVARGKKLTGIPTSGLFVMVGLPKSGKTYFTSSFPNSIVLELEKGGADRVAGRIQEIENLENLRECFKAAIEAPEIKTIVIDTLDVLNDLIESDIALGLGLTNMGESKPGVDGYAKWGEHRQRIQGLVETSKDCGKLVIFNAHCRDPKVGPDGGVIIPAGINMPGKSGPYIAAQADAIGYVYKKQIGATTQYFVSFQGGPLGTWGSRIEELEDKVIQINKNDPYGSFADVFKNGNGSVVKEQEKKVESKEVKSEKKNTGGRNN